jgi:hypothetical protein
MSARVIKLAEHIPLDLRPDANSMLEMKHSNPRYAVAEFKNWTENHVWSAKLSIELLVQLCVPANMDYSADDDVVWERLKVASRTTHRVNTNRYLVLGGGDLYFDTAMFAYLLYRDGKRRRSQFPFPKSLRL